MQGTIDNEELQRQLSHYMDESAELLDVLSQQRLEWIDRYNRRKSTAEENIVPEGKSDIVTGEIYEAVQAILPSLLKVFFSAEKTVEYVVPTSPDIAKFLTRYVNQILEEGKGILTFHSAFFDGLVKGVGLVKYWNEQQVFEIEKGSIKNRPIEELQYVTTQMLKENSNIEYEIKEHKDTGYPTGDLKWRKVDKTNKIHVESLPPESFLIDPIAKNIRTANYVAHRENVDANTLVSMGYSQDKAEELISSGTDDMTGHQETHERSIDYRGTHIDDDAINKKATLYESYIRTNAIEGKGLAKLYRVLSIGKDSVLSYEEVEECPIVAFIPYPNQHLFGGTSIAEIMSDIQTQGTALTRLTIDSFSFEVDPTWEVNQRTTDMSTVGDTESRVVQVTEGGSVRPIPIQNIGGASLPFLDRLERIKEARTGISATTQGLNPDALQSSTHSAVSATVSASKQQIEKLALLLSLSMKDLFRGLLKLVIKNHLEEGEPLRVILEGQSSEVDLSKVNTDWDVTVNVALGLMTQEDKIRALSMVIAKQELILDKMGEVNPLVTLSQYRESLSQLTAMTGLKDTNTYFLDPDNLPDAVKQSLMAKSQQPPPPDANQIFQKVEEGKQQVDLMKINSKERVEVAKLYLEIFKSQLDSEISSEKLATIWSKLGIDINKNARDAINKEMNTQINAVNSMNNNNNKKETNRNERRLGKHQL